LAEFDLKTYSQFENSAFNAQYFTISEQFNVVSMVGANQSKLFNISMSAAVCRSEA